jgi:hypothetical protein
MSSTTTAIPLNEWLRASPTLSGAAERDLECLSGYVRAGEDLLALMPRRPNRSEAEELQAATIHRGCRTVRGRFLKLHADWLYGRLTGAYTVRKNLSELAFEAAECCPGLVPTMTQIAKERTRLQAEKAVGVASGARAKITFCVRKNAEGGSARVYSKVLVEANKSHCQRQDRVPKR